MSKSSQTKMKALRWEGKSFHVTIEEVDIPKITSPLDAIVRLTSSAICGTDLHTYRGRISMNHPLTFGHENIGIVESIGSDVTTVKPGDRVVVTVSYAAELDNGNIQLSGTYGLSDYGLPVPQIDGGQAQYMRIPDANSSLLVVPPGEQHELDYLLLADIWPSAWWALDCAQQVLGDTVAIFGAGEFSTQLFVYSLLVTDKFTGPVGLLCAYSALLRGATRVYIVDKVQSRLAKAKSIGAIPIDFSAVDPVAEIMKHEPNGVDRACDCVGFEGVDAQGKNVDNLVINWAVSVTRSYGGIGLIGVYVPTDVGGKTEDEKKGVLPFPVGDVWIKGIFIKGGPALARLYQPLLKNLIESGKAKPSFVFEKEYKIEDGEQAYKDFEEHKIIKAVFRF